MPKRRWLLVPVILVLAFGCVQIIGVEPGTLGGVDGGGGGTSSSASGNTSSGSACSAGSCGVAADCPVPRPCLTRTCTSSCCGVEYAGAGEFCDSTSFSTCDGQGDCQCTLDEDCPLVTCQVPTCSGGLCTYAPADTTTPCSTGGVCDGDGGCSSP